MTAQPVKVVSLDAIICPLAAHSYHLSPEASHVQPLGPTLGQTGVACQLYCAVVIGNLSWQVRCEGQLTRFIHSCTSVLIISCRQRLARCPQKRTAITDQTKTSPNFRKCSLEPGTFLSFRESVVWQNN